MGLFKKTTMGDHIRDLEFKSRAEAFNYMLSYLITNKNLEPMEAAKQANEFAEIFANNMGIPLKPEPELKGVDKYLSNAEKIANYIEQHPKVVEYGIPLFTFIAGLFTGKKVEQYDNNHTDTINTGNNDNPESQEPKKSSINWEEID